MSGGRPRHGFTTRPGDGDAWVRTAEPSPAALPARADGFTARLTIDVAPAMRARIKLAAIGRGVSVADMVRELFEREFPEGDAR